ncbi:MAG TPA: DNA polymerase III subunit [Gemmatimonadales bacterium]|nr:DNA polymerase III subunit [Gemmatimonadales bacterium]
MPLPRVYGHPALLGRLGASIASGRFPQATLLVGPQGAGKQRIALWVGQALLCERGGGTPCGACAECRLAAELKHPDLHWLVPIPRPKATEPAKQVEEAQETLAAVMAERRQSFRYRPAEGLASHSLASVRLLQRIVGLTPVRGRRKVVILGDAERLVVQEASPEAANALLKALEEPSADTTLILTAAEPRALLPTIRSRVVPIRVGAVGDDVVREFLGAEVSPAPKGAALERLVAAAGGLIGRALSNGSESAPERADALLDAVRRGPAAWATVALAQAPWGARADFAGTLDALALRLRDVLKGDASTADRPVLARRLEAVRAVDRAREGLTTNANPQLALAVLARDLERVA